MGSPLASPASAALVGLAAPAPASPTHRRDPAEAPGFCACVPMSDDSLGRARVGLRSGHGHEDMCML